MNNPLNLVDPLGLCALQRRDGGSSCGGGDSGDCDPFIDESCDGGGGGCDSFIIHFCDPFPPVGGGGGGGGTNPPVPPPNNPGTTFPGIPAGQIVCVSVPGSGIVCARTPFPAWLIALMYGSSSVVTMGAQTNWFYSKQFDCLGVGAKEGLGGLVLKNEINALANSLLGDTNAVQGAVTPGAVAWGAEHGLESVAGNRPLIVAVRAALRQEGWKVTGNGLARGARFLGKATLAVHVGFAANEGREAYNACMAD